MSGEFVDESLHEVTGDLDGPACTVCGAIMVLKHELKRGIGVKFFICLSCGTTTGCS